MISSREYCTVRRKLSLALRIWPCGVNSITAMERLMASIKLWFSCSWCTRTEISDATLITLRTWLSLSSTGM